MDSLPIFFFDFSLNFKLKERLSFLVFSGHMIIPIISTHNEISSSAPLFDISLCFYDK